MVKCARSDVPQRCDNCDAESPVLFNGGFMGGRVQWICDECIHRIARGRAMVERAFRRRAA